MFKNIFLSTFLLSAMTLGTVTMTSTPMQAAQGFDKGNNSQLAQAKPGQSDPKSGSGTDANNSGSNTDTNRNGSGTMRTHDAAHQTNRRVEPSPTPTPGR